MDDADDYIRRVNLAIAGYERGEHVSTWVVKEHLKESIELLREMGEEVEQLKAGFELRGEALESQKSAASQFSADVTVEFERLKAEIERLKSDLRDERALTDEDYSKIELENQQLKAELGAALAEIKKVKTVEFSHKVEAVAKANYLRGLEEGVEYANDSKLLALKMGAGEHARVAATIQDRIQRKIDEAKGK